MGQIINGLAHFSFVASLATPIGTPQIAAKIRNLHPMMR
jgi:hypothetical protein